MVFEGRGYRDEIKHWTEIDYKQGGDTIMVSMTERPEATIDGEVRDAFAERLLNATIASMDVFSVHIGDRLGFYAALATSPASAMQLAERTGTHERYVREWAEQQAVTGILRVDLSGAEAVFSLPPEHAEVLLDADSLNYVAPIARLIVGATSPMAAILEAYRTGGGVPYADYGTDLREGQGDINRPSFLYELAQSWIPGMPDVLARLRAPGARVADIGAGAGWAAIGVAKEFPSASVDALDLDPASVELARANALAAGVADRVTVSLRDAADPALAHQYDLVMILEALHDMSRPVEALAAARALLREGGAVLIADERVADAFSGKSDDIERLMYGWSIFHCLPAAMAEQPSAATGTILRESTLRDYARQAGFSNVEVLPVEHLFFRLYRLNP
jgi:2-polyprenyl-3-methyl-5-hydroxy-6-metoxy-1,4-benzoquinol methylase